tara:strand:+ start:1884 stop:2564 length:681 start_codon:yes stop_codon:yes gene_type:complete
MDLTILIPCKNDKLNLKHVINDIKNIHPEINIIVVAGGDDDFDVKLLNIYSNLSYIIQQKKGYGAAIIDGIEHITTKFFIIHNADGSFEVNKIREMYNLSKTYDFVFCDRYIDKGGSEDDTFITLFGNKVFTLMTKYLLNVNLNDVLYTHVLCNTKKTKNFMLKQLDFTFCIELPYLVFRFKNKVKSLHSYEKKRISGKKNVNEFKDGFLILIYILRIFFIKFFKK